MDWPRAIERNREALEAIVKALLALFATAGGASRMSRPLRRAVLRVLRPAEAAVRRLIVIAARGVTAQARPSRPAPKGPVRRSASQRLSFPLCDTRKTFTFGRSTAGPRPVPRIHFFGAGPATANLWARPEPAPAPPPPDDGLVDGTRLARRIAALQLALSDIPRQVRRLVRLRARWAVNPRLSWKSPLRPGPPPGLRKKAVLDIDFVLRDCHALAWDALKPDTS